MINAARAIAMVLLACLLAFAAPRPVRAASDAEVLIEAAQLTFIVMCEDPNYPELKRHMKLAEAVLIIPDVKEGSGGVLIAKDHSGAWGYPAFYTIGGASVGFQQNGLHQHSEAVLPIMTEKGLDAVINHQVTLGLDVSMAVGPVGQGLGGSTTTDADSVSFVRTGGLFADFSLVGATIVKRDDWNVQFYGQGATPRAIVYDKKYSNAKADPLRESLQSESR